MGILKLRHNIPEAAQRMCVKHRTLWNHRCPPLFHNFQNTLTNGSLRWHEYSLGINLSLDITFKRIAMFTFPCRTIKIFNWEALSRLFLLCLFTVWSWLVKRWTGSTGCTVLNTFHFCDFFILIHSYNMVVWNNFQLVISQLPCTSQQNNLCGSFFSCC